MNHDRIADASKQAEEKVEGYLTLELEIREHLTTTLYLFVFKCVNHLCIRGPYTTVEIVYKKNDVN